MENQDKNSPTDAEVITSTYVIEERSDLRSTIKDALKQSGTDSIAFASVAEFLHRGDRDTIPDWIICGFKTSQDTIYRLLIHIILDASYHNCLVSILLDEDEDWCLPLCYELGIISHYFKPFTKDKAIELFADFQKSITSDPVSRTMYAGKNLNNFFSSKDDFTSLVNLEERLLNSFPTRPECFIRLAEAYILSGAEDKARDILTQAKFQDHDLSIAAKQLRDLIGDGALDDAPQMNEFANAFGLRRCVIIDSDSAVVNLYQELLPQVGIEDIKVLTDGQEAIDSLQAMGEPDLIIMEWRVPTISGASLIQRVRSLGFGRAIVMIVSSLITDKERPLLQEMGIGSVLTKPPQRDQFIATLMGAVRRDSYPSEVGDAVNRFRKASASKDLVEQEKAYDTLTARNDVPEVILKSVGAELAVNRGDLALAKTLVVQAFRMGSQDLFILNTLGRVMMAVGDNNSALKCFEHAMRYSPTNIERLCNLADASLEVEGADTDEYIAKAKAIDPNNEKVLSLEARSLIEEGTTKQAKAVLEKLPNLASVISVMNARAIAFAKKGEMDKCINIYQETLNAVPSENTLDRKKVFYNMALANARFGKHEPAIEILENELQDKALGMLYKKSHSLLIRLKKAHESGQPLVLNLKDEIEDSVLKGSRVLAIDAKPGKIGLHLIYDAGEIDPQADSKYQEAMATFTRSKGKKEK